MLRVERGQFLGQGGQVDIVFGCRRKAGLSNRPEGMLSPRFRRLGQQCLKDCQQLAERLAHSMCTARYRGCLVTHPVQGLAGGRGNRLKRLGTHQLGVSRVEFTQQLGIMDSHSQIVGHSLQSSHVVRVKSALLLAL